MGSDSNNPTTIPSSPSLDNFNKAFESILESLGDEYSKRTKKILHESEEIISLLPKLIANSTRNGPEKLSELTDSLLSDWEESAPPSASIQQLASLFSKVSLKALFSVYDTVLSRAYTPELPEIPFEVDDDDGLAFKVVQLMKANETLGATIKCDSNGHVFIARIIAGGVADRSRCVQVGDRVIEVNGSAVTGMKPCDIVKLLNSDGGSVAFKLIPTDIPMTLDYSERRYVRAMVDYVGKEDPMHPCPEAALSFTRGEVLELVVTDDHHWWQAQSFGFGTLISSDLDITDAAGISGKVGLIPSELLYERSCSSREGAKSKNASKRPFRSSPEMYESLSQVACNKFNHRPIVLIGSPGIGRNELRRRLILRNSVRYSSTVPHTSRPPRPNEIDGVDYYFVSRNTMERDIRHGKYLEFGEYNGNLYGTLSDSVLLVIKQGRTPVLNPHHPALRILRNSTFKPFIIFVRPCMDRLNDRSLFKFQMDSIGRRVSSEAEASGTSFQNYTESDLQHMAAATDQLWQLYGHYFDAIISIDDFESACRQLYSIVDKLESGPCWLPSYWQDV